MDENTYLGALEAAHRERVKSFCYLAVPDYNTRVWRLSIIERGVAGHFPISEDFFVGGEQEAQALAERLNSERLNLPSRDIAAIIASTLRGRA